MKRLLITLILLHVATLAMQAKPVDFRQVQTAASKFIEAKFNVELRDAAPEMVYAERNGAFYVFNYGTQGFVIIAADDAYRPVIGYSDESAFDARNIPPVLAYYLDGIAMGIHQLRRSGKAVATPMVAAEWESVLTRGKLISRNGGRGVDYLCQTKWDQSYPYNCCCPEDPNGSGGHAIVGCLATAMSQLMRFWASPVQGIGSHCYIHEDYGEICADFGATTYDWEHMPNVLNSASTEEEKLATGTLCFHCGVTIDMGYGPDGSGGGSAGIPTVMHQYFNYSEANVQYRRNDFETETWKTMVREQFDMGWPMYYGGCDNGGCHAFVCDGYDDFDMFHFNLGWGGSSDGWYLIDEAPYTHPADAMFNFVPAAVYNQTPSAPTAFTVVPASDTELRTLLHWTNPATTLDGTPITSIDQVVVLRDNAIIHTVNNPTPGATMDFEDTDVPRFDVFHYAVYVMVNGRHGKHADVLRVAVGPSCTWKVIMTSTDLHGWNGGRLTVYNAAGHEMASTTMENSYTTSVEPVLPLGTLSFGWTAPEDTVAMMGIIIKDSEGHNVYSFSGASYELPQGIFFTINNSCGVAQDCDDPNELFATAHGDDILLTWEPVEHVGYGYNLYRDGLLFRLIPSGNAFLDEMATMGGHCYRATVLCQSGESGGVSNETCATAGPCYPPRNLDYELTSTYKVKLDWDAPETTEGFSAFFIYRRRKDGEYQMIKIVGPTTLTFTDKTNLPEDDYYYRVCAYYQEWDCYSSPANRKGETNVFDMHVFNGPAAVEEADEEWIVAPNPTDGMLSIMGPMIQKVEIYNVVGQLVFEKPMGGESMTVDMSSMPSGLYFVNLLHRNGGMKIRKLLKQ